MGQHISHKQRIQSIGSIALIALFGLAATGCSSPTSNTPDQNLVRMWRLNQDVDPLRELITQFQKDHANTTVTYSKKTIDNYEFSALKSLAGREGPDIWSIPSDWMGDYQDQVIALPDNFFKKDGEDKIPKPSDVIKEKYPAGIAQELMSPDGTKVYGLPTNVDTLQLYINQDVFDQALQEFRTSLGSNPTDAQYQPVRQLLGRAPVTWDDVVAQSKYLIKRNGTTITRGAIALGTADNIPNANDTLQLLMAQNGAKIISDDHKSPLFHIPTSTPSGGTVRPGENALAFFTSFSDPSKATYSWNPSMPDALDAFAQGKVAMVVAYTDFGKQLKVKYPRFSPVVRAVPQISASQTPVNWIKFSIETVTKTADNPAAAFAFLKPYANEPIVKTLAQEQKLRDPFTAALTNDNGEDFQSKQILNGKSTFKLQHTRFDQLFHQMIVDVSQNGISAPDAIKGTADQIDTILNPTK